MLRAKFVYDTDCIVSYELDGHANYDIHGQDIVCSAISILHYTTREYLDKLGIEYNTREASGYSEVTLKNKQFLFIAQTPLEVLQKMLTNLSEQYPDNICVRNVKYNKDMARAMRRSSYMDRKVQRTHDGLATY